MAAFTKEDLKRFQSETLEEKRQRSFAKIGEWYSHYNNNVFVSFSGGKDSTVLADLCAEWCSIIGTPLYLLFVDTGLEYPEIKHHVKDYAEYLRKKHGIEIDLEIRRPQMRFDEVIKKYGYPIVSKEVAKVIDGARRLGEESRFGSVCLQRLNGVLVQKSGNISLFNCQKWRRLLEADFKIAHNCCDVMKKKPSHDYIKETGRMMMTAQMAEESRLRTQRWIRHGCNGFDMALPTSAPMSFWTEQDVLRYIKEEKLPIASVYGGVEYMFDPLQLRIDDVGIKTCGADLLCTTGVSRTGCIFCAFGLHLEKEPTRFQRLKETHPRQYEYCIGGGEYDEDGWWVPNAKGLGLGHVFDVMNSIYGDGFIKY